MEKNNILRISQEHYNKLYQELFRLSPVENAAAMLIGRNRQNGSIAYLVRRVIAIPREVFRVQNEVHLDIAPKFINDLIRLCESNNLGLCICHSHPRATSHIEFSSSDDYGEKHLRSVFHSILPSHPFVNLLFGNTGFIAHCFQDHNSSPDPLISIIRDGFKMMTQDNKANHFLQSDLGEQLFNRQILVFGKEGQKIISKSKVGIVGLGGTGSAIAEQLTRIGFRDIILVDFDSFEDSNLTRMFGAKNRHRLVSRVFNFFGKRLYKTFIVRENLKSIAKDIQVTVINKHVAAKSIKRVLLDCDTIYSCTDDHWGRAILNQLAYQYLIPVINVGMSIDHHDDDGIIGTVQLHILGGSNPCLECYHYLNHTTIAAESLPAKQREKLIREDYVKDLGTKTPSVINYTTLAASIGVEVGYKLITGLASSASGNLHGLRYDVISNRMNRFSTEKKSPCICQQVYGKGDFHPLPHIDDQLLPEDFR